MKKIIKLTESDLTRIVKRVLNEEDETFDFSETDKKLWSDYFTIKNGFKYVGNKDGFEFYSLKRNGFTLVVGVNLFMEGKETVGLSVFLVFPMGKKINYLQEVRGVKGMVLKINEFGKLSEILRRAIDFGNAQSDYDNLPPLPKL